LHHENKAVPDVVYERNVLFFLTITLDHTRIVGLKSQRNKEADCRSNTRDSRFILLRRFSTHLFQNRSADSRYRPLSEIPTYCGTPDGTCI